MPQIAILKENAPAAAYARKPAPLARSTCKDGKPELNAACKVCGICLKACPEKAILRLETKQESVDKSQWNDILVFAEVSGGLPAPREPGVDRQGAGAGKKRRFSRSKAVHDRQRCGAVRRGTALLRSEREIAVYDDPALSFFRADAFRLVRGGLYQEEQTQRRAGGRDLSGPQPCAPAVHALPYGADGGLHEAGAAGEHRSGADPPAFGGNIMAQIVTTNTRPQFATVRYKVMDAPVRQEDRVREPIVRRKLPRARYASRPSPTCAPCPCPPGKTISDAEILVVGGRGLQKEADLEMIKEAARLLGGDWAVPHALWQKKAGAKTTGRSGCPGARCAPSSSSPAG